MSSRLLAGLSVTLAVAGAAWGALWAAWLVAQHRAGALDPAAALLGAALLILPTLVVAWGGAALLALRARRRAREEAAARLERRLAEAVRTRGRVRLAALAREWGVTEGDLAAALESLVGLGVFRGRVDWDRGEAFAEGAAPEAPCPNCGGVLVPAGQGLLACRHCGSRFTVDRDDPSREGRASPEVSNRGAGSD